VSCYPPSATPQPGAATGLYAAVERAYDDAWPVPLRDPQPREIAASWSTFGDPVVSWRYCRAAMNERRTSPRPGSRVPSVRPPAGADGQGAPSEGGPGARGPSSAAGRRRPSPLTWRRLTRSRRSAAGLGIGAAVLLLWPFSDWSWWPWAAGLGALVLLRLLRLDGLLRGWVFHLAGLVVLAGLMVDTGPWDWALAASIGLLLAGLVQLPEWRIAAAGAALCVVTGAGYGFASYQSAEAQRRLDEQRSEQSFSLLGERSPERVLPALLEGIGQGDTVGVCGLLDVAARDQFVRASGAVDCAAAVRAFRGSLGRPPQIRNLDAPVTPGTDGWVTDGCRTVWATEGLGGPTLGRLEVRRSQPPGRTFFIAGFQAC
jgi:hypothetical protein